MKKILFILFLFSGTCFAQQGAIKLFGNPLAGSGGSCNGGTPGSSNTWTKKTNFPGNGRQYATALSINNLVYFGLGADTATGLGNQDWWEFNPCTSVWTQKANFGGSARQLCFSFAIGNYGYVGGGTDNAILLKQDFYRYDQVANSWTAKTDYGGGVISEAMGFTDGTDGFVAGGQFGFSFGQITDICYRYNVGANTWTARTSMPAKKYAGASYTIGTKGYAVCGVSDAFVYTTTNYEFNFSANTWATKTAFGGAGRGNVTGFSIGSNNGYVGCGNDASVSYQDFYVYSQSGNTWTAKTNYGGGLTTGAAACATATLGFYITGTKTGNDKDMYSYSP